jgi:hypothetical protein
MVPGAAPDERIVCLLAEFSVRFKAGRKTKTVRSLENPDAE